MSEISFFVCYLEFKFNFTFKKLIYPPSVIPVANLRPRMTLQENQNCEFTKSGVLSAHQVPGGNTHSHEVLTHPGIFANREQPINPSRRDFDQRSFTVGIGGPVGSGKTALMLALCRFFTGKSEVFKQNPSLTGEVKTICSITNDIFTREDGEFLLRHEALSPERIRAIETGGCPHAAIREDVSANLQAAEELTKEFAPDLILLESGGDNLAANYSRELADYIIYVIDVAGGDKVPRKGGPGVTESDLLIINKTDLAEAVGADLSVMDRDAKKMRGDGPTVFAQVKNGVAVDEIVKHIVEAHRASVAIKKTN